jgi:hypothetical protein
VTTQFDMSVPEDFQGEDEETQTPAAQIDVQPEEADSAEAWITHATEGAVYTLPGSGRKARIRKVPLMAMSIGAGYVPNKLATEVLRFLAEIDQERGYGETVPEAKRIEQYKKRAAAFCHIVQMAFVEPRVVLAGQPGPGEISIAHLADRDIMWVVFALVEGEEQPVTAPFRQS